MTLKNEISTLRNAIAPKLSGFTFALQQDVKKPAKNLCAIKRTDSTVGNVLTSHAYANKSTFRFVIYGASELEVQNNAELIGTHFANHNKIKIELESAYFSVGSFSCSDSFETETAGIYAIIAYLPATRYELREQDSTTTLQQLYVTRR